MERECRGLNAEELQLPKILERLRTRGIGGYLFQSPLDEKDKEPMAKLLLKAEGVNPCVLSVNDFIARMWGYYQIGEREESLASANRALNLDSDNLVALNCIVYLLADSVRYTEAREAFEHFVRVSKNRQSGFSLPRK